MKVLFLFAVQALTGVLLSFVLGHFGKPVPWHVCWAAVFVFRYLVRGLGNQESK